MHAPVGNSGPRQGLLGSRRLAWRWAVVGLGLVVPWVMLGGGRATGLEHLEVRRDELDDSLSGEVVVEAQDGGLMLRTSDGGLHVLPASAIVSRRTDDQPFELLDREGLAAALLQELPPGFQIHDSDNYVVCYNTTRTYARWCSSLLERLHKAFLVHWQKKGCDVESPKIPLPVLVFGDQASYAAYARRDLGGAPGSIIGYYSIASNRVMMYDLTGMQGLQTEAARRGSLHDITALLTLPAAEPLLATIVHEATHQIAFNCGLQTRYADNPLWLSEGMAAYFETPDASSARGWRGIGKVNYARWDRFRENYVRGRNAPLELLIGDDKMFRDPERALDGYAQAWAWNYFLIRSRPAEFVAYLERVAARPVLVEASSAERLADFKTCFGDDLEQLQAEFLRHMERIR